MTCYHVYTVSEGARGLFRIRHCWNTKQAANQASLPAGGHSHLDGKGVKTKMVLKCLPNCDCHTQRRRPCPNAPRPEAPTVETPTVETPAPKKGGIPVGVMQVYANVQAWGKAQDMYKKGIKATCYTIAAVAHEDMKRYERIIYSLTGIDWESTPRYPTQGKAANWNPHSR